MWISIEQSVMVYDIVYVSMGFVVRDWSCAVGYTNYGGGHCGIDNYRSCNYLSGFIENCPEGVYMCQDGACKIICLSDHPFKSYGQKSKAPYMSIIG